MPGACDLGVVNRDLYLRMYLRARAGRCDPPCSLLHPAPPESRPPPPPSCATKEMHLRQMPLFRAALM
jgi:hypothetical protein